MDKLGLFLKVNSDGILTTIDIKRENGLTVLPASQWEQAVEFTLLFDLVNKTYTQLLDEYRRKNQ